MNDLKNYDESITNNSKKSRTLSKEYQKYLYIKYTKHHSDSLILQALSRALFCVDCAYFTKIIYILDFLQTTGLIFKHAKKNALHFIENLNVYKTKIIKME